MTLDVRDVDGALHLKSAMSYLGDGTFVADYEYVEGLGDLDQCNGRLCVTPEFPSGIYAYFLTDGWPSIPHWLRGVPDGTFTPQNNGSQGPPTGGPPGTGGGPPPR